MYRNRLIAGIALGLVLSVAAQGEEKKIKQSKLPPAVQKTADENVNGATVTGYTSDKVEGAMVYTMDLVADGKTRGINMDTDGNILSVEQEVAWADLPAEVQKDLSSTSSKGKLGPVSTVSENGNLVAYKAVLVVNGTRHHVLLKPKAAADVAPMPAAAPGASK
jgi:hypothetical protein